jgi:uncharacterized RDD family membrane protein YckC
VTQAVLVADQPAIAPIEGAGFLIRALARLIDLAAHFAVTTVTGLAAGVVIALAAVVVQADPQAAVGRVTVTPVLGYLAALAGGAWLHVASEWLHGSTFGKRLCGLTVVRDDGSLPPGFAAALRRTIAFYVDSLFFGAVAWSKMQESLRRQRIGDKWAHTMVVQRKTVPVSSRPSSLRFVAGLALGIVGDSAVVFVEVMSRLL